MTAKGRLLSRAVKRLHAKTCEIFSKATGVTGFFPSELCNCMYYWKTGVTGVKKFDDMSKRLVTIPTLDRR